MIGLSIEPPSIAAGVSRVVTVRIANPDSRPFTNVVLGLAVPAGLGLEQGRSRVDLVRLDGGAAHEHVLRVRPPRPGPFTIGVPNLSFRNGYGRAQRERDRCVEIVVEAADEPTDEPTVRSVVEDETALRPDVASIFVSYRRDDTRMIVGPLVRDLGRHRALRQVDLFLDIRDIRTGTTWPAVLDDELQACRLLVAVIGPNWMRPDDRGSRLHDADDVVRREIAVALRRGIPLLPLLVDAPMPDPADLMPDVRDLTRWQAFRFDLADYDRSVKRLAKRVAEILT
jgi:TIR domain